MYIQKLIYLNKSHLPQQLLSHLISPWPKFRPMIPTPLHLILNRLKSLFLGYEYSLQKIFRHRQSEESQTCRPQHSRVESLTTEWVTELPIHLAAAQEMLGEEHERPPRIGYKCERSIDYKEKRLDSK